MGKQYNKAIKRNRREGYIKRKKVAIKAKSAKFNRARKRKPDFSSVRRANRKPPAPGGFLFTTPSRSACEGR